MESVVNKELATKLLRLLKSALFGNHIMNNLYLSLLSYGLLITTLGKIPERFWDFLLRCLDKSTGIFVLSKKKIPLIGEIIHGEELLLNLAVAEGRITQGIKILPNHLARYKFYTELLEQLFESQRKLGIGIKKFIPEIRLAIIRDLRFEKKIFDECVGAFLQFVVISATTWSFVFLSSMLVNIPLNKLILLFMLLLQVLGVLVFFQLLRLLKKKTFTKFSEAIKELYLFHSLVEVGLPLNEILARSRLLNGSLMNHKLFKPLASRVKNLIDRLKETGLSPKDEAQEIIQGLWHLQDENFTKFTKKVQALKFSILAFFFLPAYFMYLYSIFQFFMEQ